MRLFSYVEMKPSWYTLTVVGDLSDEDEKIVLDSLQMILLDGVGDPVIGIRAYSCEQSPHPFPGPIIGSVQTSVGKVLIGIRMGGGPFPMSEDEQRLWDEFPPRS